MTAAMQTALAGEHAAVWIYGVLGGQTSQSAEPTLYDEVSTAYALHRSRRDQLMRWIRDDAGTPVPADVAYELPNEVRNPSQVRTAARQVENRCTSTYAVLISNTESTRRDWAIRALVDAATREVRLGAKPVAMPGY
ncbi:MAG: ferritin-like domain-containing protein [Nocardioides sp.]|nr:ferritin-like domain-containing protein [Nocardioides sp.]